MSSVKVTCTSSPAQRLSISSVPPLTPVCSLDCSSCRSILNLNSHRRMTSPNPLAMSYLGQILLRLPFIFTIPAGEEMRIKCLPQTFADCFSLGIS